MVLGLVELFVSMITNFIKKQNSLEDGEDHQQILMSLKSIKHRFNIKISGIDYDAKYIFSELGYNFLPSELSAAFALEQIKKLKQ
jgi:CDP-6-deoxy-D-xylo-4-hexulose-3-dehydrase